MSKIEIMPHVTVDARLLLNSLHETAGQVDVMAVGMLMKDGTYLTAITDDANPGDVHLIGAFIQKEAMNLAGEVVDE